MDRDVQVRLLKDKLVEAQLRDKEASLACETADGRTFNVVGNAYELYKEARRDYSNLKALLTLLETPDVNN